MLQRNSKVEKEYIMESIDPNDEGYGRRGGESISGLRNLR